MSLRGIRLIERTNKDVEGALRLFGGSSPWGVYDFRIMGCVYRNLADSFSANLLQIVFLEVNPFAEETFFGIACCMRLISDRCQFNAAYVIGDLGQVIRCRRDVAVDDGFFGNRVLDCAVNRAFDYFLAVVVVNLNGVERLEEFEIVAYCQIDISTYFVFKGLLGRELAFQVSKCSIFEVNFLSKDSKCSEVHIARD